MPDEEQKAGEGAADLHSIISTRDMPNGARLSAATAPVEKLKAATTLRDELIKIAFDKFLIGAILVVFGLLANKALEQFKTRQSFEAEVAKTRVQKIAEVWEKVYLYETLVERTLPRVIEILSSPALTSRALTSRGALTRHDAELLGNAAKISSAVLQGADDVINSAQRNRFWIGEAEYTAIIDYVNKTVAYVGAVQKGTARSKELDARSKARANIDGIVHRLLQQAN